MTELITDLGHTTQTKQSGEHTRSFKLTVLGHAIRISFMLYVALLAAWIFQKAYLLDYSPWPALLLTVGPFSLFIYGIKNLQPRSLIYLNFFLLLYFCISVLGLFSPDTFVFFWAITETATLSILFCSIFVYLRTLEKTS